MHGDLDALLGAAPAKLSELELLLSQVVGAIDGCASHDWSPGPLQGWIQFGIEPLSAEIGLETPPIHWDRTSVVKDRLLNHRVQRVTIFSRPPDTLGRRYTIMFSDVSSVMIQWVPGRITAHRSNVTSWLRAVRHVGEVVSNLPAHLAADPSAEDPYVPASCLWQSRFDTYAQFKRWFDKIPDSTIRRCKPWTQRLEIHAADWVRYWSQKDIAEFESLDEVSMSAKLADAAAKVRERRRK